MEDDGHRVVRSLRQSAIDQLFESVKSVEEVMC